MSSGEVRCWTVAGSIRRRADRVNSGSAIPSPALLEIVCELRKPTLAVLGDAVETRRNVVVFGSAGVETSWLILNLMQARSQLNAQEIVLLADVTGARKRVLSEIVLQVTGIEPAASVSCDELYRTILAAIHKSGPITLFITDCGKVKPQVESDLSSFLSAGVMVVMGFEGEQIPAEGLASRCEKKVKLESFTEEETSRFLDVTLREAGKAVDNKDAVFRSLHEKCGGKALYLLQALSSTEDVKVTKSRVDDIESFGQEARHGYFGVLLIIISVILLAITRYAIYYSQAGRSEKVLTATGWVLALVLKFVYFAVLRKEPRKS